MPSSVMQGRISAVYTVLTQQNPNNMWINPDWIGVEAGKYLPAPLNNRQVHNAVAAMRDAYPRVPILTKLGRWGGYKISADEDDQSLYRGQTFLSIRTRATRFSRNIEQDLQRMEALGGTAAADARRVRLSVQRLIQDIGFVLNGAANGATP